jgi:hypothetical protein
MKRTLAVVGAAAVVVIVATMFFEDRTTGQPPRQTQAPQDRDPLPGTN